MRTSTSIQSRRPVRAWIAFAFWSIAFLSCAILTDLALHHAVMGDLRMLSAVGTLAMIAALSVLFSATQSRTVMLVSLFALVIAILVRVLFYGIAEFSGGGFSSELFIHMEPESLRVVWLEYRTLLLAILAGLIVLVGSALALASRRDRPRSTWMPWMLVPALIVVALCRQGLPEWMLIESLHAWYSPKRLNMPEPELQVWRDSGMINVDLKKKSEIDVQLPARARNLVLLYIESVGVRVIEHPSYPGLMPNLARLMHERSLVPSVHASSYITIEGIVNSQCGTLFPFERDSASLVGFDSTAEELPCLGDILKAAGYVQSYLGGADLSFAGKRNFLRSHGYDKLVGQHQWAEQGLHQRPGTWGVSDADLFDQSLLELASLSATGKPFNLTLLTIGTHLPGFAYAECRPYGSGKEVFLNALHCTDQLIERWLSRLETGGYMQDTTVVITGDHHVFPNREMQRLFGSDATSDRRLPFIVLGDAIPAAVAMDGAGVDLAPTLLDLLGVKHNAIFALGRSLLRPSSARDYHVTRYQDIYRNQVVNLEEGPCSNRVVPGSLLNECDKNSLLTLLRIQNAAFSLPQVQLECDRAERTRIFIPDAADKPMQFLVDGKEQIGRFSWSERTVRQPAAGLYAIAFDAEGALLQRQFIPEDLILTHAIAPPVVNETQTLLVAWRGSGPQSQPPAWFGDASSDGAAGAKLYDGKGILRQTIPRQHIDADSIFILDSETCTSIGNTG